MKNQSKFHLNMIKWLNPEQGYCPERFKNIPNAHPNNIEAGKLFGLCHGFKVCTGACYLGGFIEGDKSKRDCLDKSTNTWERNITKIWKTMVKYPQESYVAVVREIQSEWIFLQCNTNNTGDAFVGTEKILWDFFLPRLFSGESKSLTPLIWDISTIPVKKSSLGLQNPVMSKDENF